MGNIATGLKDEMIIIPLENGTYKIEIPDWQGRLFHNLVEEIKGFIENKGNPLANLLFPVAYQNDEAANIEYDSLTHEDLLQSHLSALKTLVEVSETEIDEVPEETLLQIMQAVNILRLALGTRLEIRDEDDPSAITENHPDYNLWLIYHLLGENLSIIVDSISE